MYLLIAIIVISISCILSIKIFMKDNVHDVEIEAGKFKFSIKKH